MRRQGDRSLEVGAVVTDGAKKSGPDELRTRSGPSPAPAGGDRTAARVDEKATPGWMLNGVEAALREVSPRWLSMNELCRLTREGGTQGRWETLRKAAAMLAATGRCETMAGPRGACLFRVSGGQEEAGTPADVEPVGIVEIAARLGVKRQTVDVWKIRGVLPAPRWLVGGRPCWLWSDVERWAQETGRLG